MNLKLGYIGLPLVWIDFMLRMQLKGLASLAAKQKLMFAVDFPALRNEITWVVLIGDQRMGVVDKPRCVGAPVISVSERKWVDGAVDQPAV